MMAEELKILEDYLELIHQRTDGRCPICYAPDYPVSGDKQGYNEVLPEDADEYHCDHAEDCAVTIIEKFIASWDDLMQQRNELQDRLRFKSDLAEQRYKVAMAHSKTIVELTGTINDLCTKQDELLEALGAADLSLAECTKHLLGTGPIPDPEAVALTIIQIKQAIARAKEQK